MIITFRVWTSSLAFSSTSSTERDVCHGPPPAPRTAVVFDKVEENVKIKKN